MMHDETDDLVASVIDGGHGPEPLTDAVTRIRSIAGDLTDNDVLRLDPPYDLWSQIAARVDQERVNEQADRPEPADRTERVADVRLAAAPGEGTADTDATTSATVTDLGSRRRTTRLLAVAAAVAIFGGVGGVWLASDDQPTRELAAPELVSTASLAALDGSGQSASAELVRETDGRLHLELSAAAMAAPPDGSFFELWLIDPAVSTPKSLGRMPVTNGGPASVDVVVPAGVDPIAFPIVDISVEVDDGDDTHSGDSVLRGQLE